MKTQWKLLLVFCLSMFLSLFVFGCGDDDDDDSAKSDDDDDLPAVASAKVGDDDDDTVPDDIIDPPNQMPFYIEREQVGQAPTAQEVATFTQTMKDFYENTGYFDWAAWHSVGVHEDNQWGEPTFKVWYTNTYSIKSGNDVTITWNTPSDNSTAKVGRVLPNAISLYLQNGDEAARELAFGYIKGLSGMYDGFVFAEEDPVVDSIMARGIFHRNQTYEVKPGKTLTVDFDSVRYEVEERRHDTWHNPNNPTWGDIYVRNKRSKDDFPYLYRNIPLLARLIRTSDDVELVEAAIKLYRQIGAMARDIVDSGYIIRTKGPEGEIFIPRTEAGIVDDFATFTLYEILFPRAECNAKLGTVYIGYNNKLDNECLGGDGGLYEFISIYSAFWHSNMIWGYHVTAISLALAYGDYDTARDLLYGFADRIDGYMGHWLFADKFVEWYADIAQLLVLAAAYGYPLTNEEAQLVIEQFEKAVAHYGAFEYWDLYDASIPDGEYEHIPDRYSYDGTGEQIDCVPRITEIANFYEYCYSPLKDPNGAKFIDCDALLGID